MNNVAMDKETVLAAIKYCLKHMIDFEERLVWITEDKVFIQNVFLEKCLREYFRQNGIEGVFREHLLYEYGLVSRRIIVSPYTTLSTILIQEIEVDLIWEATVSPPLALWSFHPLANNHLRRFGGAWDAQSSIVNQVRRFENLRIGMYPSIFLLYPQIAVLLPISTRQTSPLEEPSLHTIPHVTLAIYPDMEEIERSQDAMRSSK